MIFEDNLPMWWVSSFDFRTAENSVGDIHFLESSRRETSLIPQTSGSTISISPEIRNENMVEAKPEPYENIPILFPSKLVVSLLNKEQKDYY